MKKVIRLVGHIMSFVGGMIAFGLGVVLLVEGSPVEDPLLSLVAIVLMFVGNLMTKVKD